MASAPKIGVDMAYVARLTGDSDSALTYNTPVKVPGTVKVSVDPTGNLITDYGDNMAYFTTNARGNTKLSLEFIDTDPALMASLLGQTRANGITAEQAVDQSPYYAFGFRVWIGGDDGAGNKIYKYYWLLKGKFAVPKEDFETKKETITPQHVMLDAEFISTMYNKNIETHGRTDYSLSSTDAANWFNAPVIAPTVNTNALGVTIAKSTTDITFTFAKTGGGTFSIATDTAVIGSTILVDKAGALQAGTIAWTGQGTASVVGTFTPTTAFGTATILATVTSGVKDLNGIGCTPAMKSLSYP